MIWRKRRQKKTMCVCVHYIDTHIYAYGGGVERYLSRSHKKKYI